MVLLQKWPFFLFSFQAIKARKMSFMICQNEKMPFQGLKTRSSKSRKIDIFPKGLTHGFGPKMAIFSIFFFVGNKGQENVFMIFFNEKRFFQAIKIRSSNSRKIEIFLMVSVQELPYFQLFFSGNLGQEKVFYDILEEENVFLGLKNQKFKKSNN